MSEMYNNDFRTPYFKKDGYLEKVLIELNEAISSIEGNHVNTSNTGPIFLIMGCPRAGSTVMLQWLASLNVFSYPSNLIARFYSNPYIGIRVQQALLEFDPLNQIGFDLSKNDFQSNLGKTIGALQPSEYWYYWRNYFEFDADSSVLSQNQLESVDGHSFIQNLRLFEALSERPTVLKGMLMNYHMEYLYKLYPKFIFINLVRDTFYNAQSLLLARDKYFDDRNKWYSFKPPEYRELKEMDPISQVAGQVVYMQYAVKSSLSKLPENNVITISYSDFCDNPNNLYKTMCKKYKELGGLIKLPEGPFRQDGIRVNNTVKLSDADASDLHEKIARFKAELK